MSQAVTILKAIIEGISDRLASDVAHGISRSALAKRLAMLDPGYSRNDLTLPKSAPGPRSSRGEKTCSVDDCQRPSRARGMCSKHYQRLRYAEQRQSDADGSYAAGMLRGNGRCSQEGCENVVYAKQMCGRHFMAWVRSRRKTDN
jgi:hypothetical protein